MLKREPSTPTNSVMLNVFALMLAFTLVGCETERTEYAEQTEHAAKTERLDRDMAIGAGSPVGVKTPFAITHVNVIDMAGAQGTSDTLGTVGMPVTSGTPGAALMPDATVIIEGGRIAAIAASDEIEIPSGATIIDATGKYLIPGLWDMHIHVSLLGGPDILPVFTAYGITGVRDQGGPDSIFIWKKETEEGLRVGPRIVAAARYIISTDVFASENSVNAGSPSAAKEIVSDLIADGAEYIKIQDGLMPRKTWLALAREAEKHHLPLAGHTPVAVPLTEAIRAGLVSIEHTLGMAISLTPREDALRQRVMMAAADPMGGWAALFKADAEALSALDENRLREVGALMVEHGVAFDPTLSDSRAMATASSGEWRDDPDLVLLPPGIRDAWIAASKDAFYGGENEINLRRMYDRIPAVVARFNEMGVMILAGTDAGATFDFPGRGLHDELVLLVDAGLSPLEALQTATRNPAEFLGISDSAGTIQIGKRADLVLLDANPLADIRNTRRISGVLQAGRYFDRAELDTLLNSARETNQ